ncbi:hypothetical protein C1886_06645 [Pseudomonas sp. FW300-N1A1]|nr:hypothetical protein C1886_06645 [Pseudomonas sp. FW300-N1A1]
MKSAMALAAVLSACVSMPTLASEPASWTQLLNDPELMPAVISCLAAHPTGEGPALVMDAGHANLNELWVTTTDLSGRRNSCTASKDSGVVTRSETLFDLPGPLFVSVAHTAVAPKGVCIESTPVVLNHQLQGWILRQPVLALDIPSPCSSPKWSELLAE